MGNIGSNSGVNNRRRSSGNGSGQRIHPPPVRPQPEITANQFMYPAVATTTYHNYPGYYPPPPPSMPMPLTAPYDHNHRPVMDPMWGRYPQPQLQQPPPPMPYVEHQKAVTIRNDVNIKKDTLRIEPDEDNPRRFVVSFMFDATIDGRVQFPMRIWGVRLNSKVKCC